MQKYTRKHFLGVATGAVAGLYVAGCGGGSGGGASGSVDVLYDWTYNGPPGTVADYWKEIRNRLREKGGGATIGDLSEVPFEALYQRVPAAIKAQSGPSLATWYADYATYNLARNEDIAALGDYVGSDESGHWLLASTKVGDSYYGAPLVLEVAVLLINRRHFDKAKIDVAGQFESYDAFIEACDRLKAAGITPLQAGTSDGVGAEQWSMFEQMQVCEAPSQLLQGVIGDIPLDDPVFARPRDQIPVLVDNYMNPNPQNDTHQMCVDKFMAGDAGMTIAYTASILASDTGSEFEVIGFPKSDAKFNRAAIGTGDTVMIMGYADDKDASGEIIDFLHEEDQLKLWWDLTGSIPADDRFNSALLPPEGKKIWDMIEVGGGDVYSLWWPDNFYPPSVALPYIGVQQQLFAGASPDEARDATEAEFTKFQENNPAEVETVKDYITNLQDQGA